MIRPVAVLLLTTLVPAAYFPAAGQQPTPAPPVEPQSTVPPAPAEDPGPAPQGEVRPPFAEWLVDVRKEALARGIRPEIADAAFAGLEPLAIVIERDRSQAEFTLTLDGYLKRRLTPAFIRDTRRALAANRTLLRKVTARYGVPEAVVVAIWGLESNFGRFAGVRPTIRTLATLAWEGRRASFFREQLLQALEILNRGDIQPERLKGSWAGAIGQVQFMPSSYNRFAQDFDGDGRRDVWGSRPDVFASIANYLKEHGWRAEDGWGREVKVPAASGDEIALAAPLRDQGCRAEREMSEPLPLARWRELGVQTATGRPLPGADGVASLVRTDTRAFLVSHNYGALLAYNCAHQYALSVGLLADRIVR